MERKFPTESVEMEGRRAQESSTDSVDDLVGRGDVDGAVSILQSSISRLATGETPRDPDGEGLTVSIKSSCDHEDDDDDWEAIADRGAMGEESVISSWQGDGVPSTASWEGREKLHGPKRRGRGSFLYEKSYLYSDQQDGPIPCSGDGAGADDEPEEQNVIGDLNCGTNHALVLYDFPPSTRSTELEKLLERFKDRGFAIRWVDDTTALAVFRTPHIASEAQSSIQFPFKVRRLEQGDRLLSQISSKDLDPPIPRPRTSVRTAQRLIAHGMGMKPSTMFGSSELRKQEEERKSRIRNRQNMRDDAWGSD